MRIGIVAASVTLLALSGCARDVVLKPAVLDFVDKAKTATAAASQVYAKIGVDRETAVAITLADNPQCGLVTNYALRRPADDAILSTPAAQAAANQYKAKSNLPGLTIPHKGLICLSPDEVIIIREIDPTYVLQREDVHASAGVASIPVIDFKPQIDTINSMIDYIALLAKSAGQPNLVVKDDIASVVTKLNTVTTDSTSAAVSLGVLGAANQTSIADVQNQITKYSGAVNGLANDIENYVKQEQDVRAIRSQLLSKDDNFDKHANEAGYDADCWLVFDLALQRDNLIKSVGAGSDYAQLAFATRFDIAQKFLNDAKIIDQKAQCFTLPASTASLAPKNTDKPDPIGSAGDMIRELVKSHDALVHIANDHLTPKQRHDEIIATLEQLGSTLVHIAAIAALFL